MRCSICKSTSLKEIPTHLNNAMRSDGVFYSSPLKKIMCLKCNVVIGNNVMIEEPYSRSNGKSIFESQRHDLLAQNIATIMQGIERVESVLEIGAANFQTAIKIKKIFPDINMTAIEPSPENVPTDVNINIDIIELDSVLEDNKYDFIYSNNVIEHVERPLEFLRKVKRIMHKDSFLLILCPNSNLPHQELLFLDHLYHFSIKSMKCLAKQAKLNLIYAQPAFWDQQTEVFLFKSSFKPTKKHLQKDMSCQKLYHAKRDYFKKWSKLQVGLLEKISCKGNLELIIFGAGEFSQLVQVYLPLIYEKASFIVVDDISGVRNHNIPIKISSSISLEDKIVLIASNPKSSKKILHKLKQRGAKNILCLNI